jgi:N-acetylglucosamine-6-phosphate deacetylase
MDDNNNRLLIKNARLYTPGDVWDPGWMLVEGGRIRLLQPGEPPEFPQGLISRSLDAQQLNLLPGLVDVHVHGGVGFEVMDASPDKLCELARYYARHGVTAFLPTTWTASRKDTMNALLAIGQVMGPVEHGAAILGTHLEGPYLNAARCGAQDVSLIRRADREEALEFLDTGLVRMMTVAPEFAENEWLIDECVQRGITVSAGHTAATYEQIEAFAHRGVRQMTHTFNAMTSLSHREPGTVGAAMAFNEIDCQLIADNIHVHPAVMDILVKVKGVQRVILVTDAIRGAGLPDGEYPIGDRTITVKDGAVRLPDGTLSGSTLTMDKALQNIMTAARLDLAEAWPMSSLNAARSIGVSNRKGSLEVGKDADLVLLDDACKVYLTLVEGQIAWSETSLLTNLKK